jgi:hypothetical protein
MCGGSHEENECHKRSGSSSVCDAELNAMEMSPVRKSKSRKIIVVVLRLALCKTCRAVHYIMPAYLRGM